MEALDDEEEIASLKVAYANFIGQASSSLFFLLSHLTAYHGFAIRRFSSPFLFRVQKNKIFSFFYCM